VFEITVKLHTENHLALLRNSVHDFAFIFVFVCLVLVASNFNLLTEAKT
jgi:hypothetical protein